jgi:hypothetical protein
LRSYLVLTPPENRQDRNDPDAALFLRDGFSWVAFVFPWAWLGWNRLWLATILAVAVEIGAGVLGNLSGFWLAGMLLGFAFHLLVALEGRHYLSEVLQRSGFTLDSAILAPDIATAEQIYFSALPARERQALPVVADWARQSHPSAGQDTGHSAPTAAGPALGLFDHGGR